MNHNRLQFHRYIIFSILLPLLVFAGFAAAYAALNENCTVSVLNRTAQVKPDGSWVIPNVPSNMGKVRVRATCVENGVTRSGQSDWVTIPPNGSIKVGDIQLDVFEPVPSAVAITSPSTPDMILNPVGTTAQLVVTATYPDGSTSNITLGSKGTVYGTTNPNIATVSEDGLITATGTGRVIISASNEMVLSSLMFTVTNTTGNNDVDNDGIPDDWELSNGLNPNDAIDALEDADHDGLTNKQEYDNATLLRIADSDGDGINDGEEVKPGRDGFITNPLLADSDGDGVRDGLEVQTGSDPTNSASINLAQALSRLEVAPSNFVLIFNTIMSEASRQLTVTGVLTDGTRIDLTSTTRGTNYNSSDFAVANFGSTDGLVYAGANGVASITASNNGFNAVSRATVRAFSPTALSSIAIPGYANNVDVNGNYAYVAAGSSGLQVVDVSNPRSPQIIGSRDTSGTAIDVRVVGNYAYIADGESGLQVLDISNPASPTIVGSLDTPGIAQDVWISGTLAFIADGANGLTIINVGIPASPTLEGSVDTPGTAKGVAVSGNYALIADGSTLKVIDITNPALPQIVGTVNIPGDTKDLTVRDNYAYITAFTSGLQIVDFSNPALPTIVGSLPTQFVPRDVELWGQFAFFAEQLFPNVIAIADVIDPLNPIFRAILDLSSLGDYAGTGIAVANNYVYVTEESFYVGIDYGSTGNTRLFAGQYAEIVDSGTTPPTVSITSPLNNAEVMEGAILPVTVSATDDVLTASVNLLVDGNIVSTDNAAPFEFNYQVPVGITSLAIGATGIDLANNTGTAPNVFLSVIPDPPPTVSITSPADNSDVVEGSTLTITADAFDNSGVTRVDFLLDGEVVETDSSSPFQVLHQIPFGITTRTISARAIDLVGKVGTSAGVTINVIENPAPVVSITSPQNGDTLFEGAGINIQVNAVDNDSVASVEVFVNDVSAGTDTTSPFSVSIHVPTGVTSLTIGARATDNLGKAGIADNITVNVIPDPGTTVIGTVVDDLSQPVEGVAVSTIGGMSSVTLADGTFSISGVPTIQGNIIVNAVAVINSETLRGNSASLPPVAGGVTDVGQIRIRSGYAVLILADADTTGTTALADALSAAGNMVTLRPAPEYTWNGTNPPLAGFDCVIHLDGATWTQPLPVASQLELVDFVRNGGGFMSSQWDGYERTQGYQTSMNDLILMGYPGPYNASGGNFTWRVVPGMEGHPVLTGIPESFTFYGDGHSDGAQIVFSENPSTVIMRAGNGTGGPAVIVREFGSGRVVNFAHAANYPYPSRDGLTLQDTNIQQLYKNAVNWACSNSVAMNRTTVTGLIVDGNANPVQGAVVSIGSLTQTTGADGRFSTNMWTTGNITVSAYAFIGGVLYTGSSFPVAPVNNGTTDVGTIIINPAIMSQAINETFGAGFNPDIWFFGGSAGHDNTNENIMAAPVTGGAGRVFYLTPFMADSFRAEFDYDISGGSGADGLTFAWVQDYNYQESGGGFLNFDGANGFAVEFDTWPGNSGDTGARHIGVLHNYTSNHLVTFDTETRGTHHVIINFAYGTIHILFDGTEVINYTIPNYTPFNAYFGFTAATGGSTDNHIIDNFILNVGSLVN